VTEDQQTLNSRGASEQASSVKEALNYPDAVEMFQNLHSHGIKTLRAEITPDMSAEDRAKELLVAGEEATQEAGISMPEEQRALEATQMLHHVYEEDYSLGA